MNIIEELYHGNIHTNETCFSRSSHYAKFVAIVSENEEKITEFLQALPNAEQEQHLLSQMMNAQSEINLFEGREKFIEGFRLGAMFMLDTFVVEQESAIRDIK